MKDAVEFNSKLVTHRFMGDNDIIMDAWGRQKVVYDYSLFLSVFVYGIQDEIWKYTQNVSVLNNELIVGNNSKISSRRHMRYQPNRGQLFSTACFIPNQNGKVRYGLFNDENGVFFEYDNGILYGVVRTKYNSQIIEDRKEIALPEGFDISKGNVYDIQFQWRGVGNYRFMINLDEVLVFDYLGKLDRLSMSNPSLPISVENISNDSNFILKTSCFDVTSEGGKTPKLFYDNVLNPTDRVVNQTGAPILSLQMKSTFKGNINTIDYRILKAIFTTDKKSEFSIYYTEDPTAITGASWIDDNNSAHIVDYSATALNISKCKRIAYRSYSSGGSFEISGFLDVLERILSAGEILIIFAQGNSATVRGSFDIGVEI